MTTDLQTARRFRDAEEIIEHLRGLALLGSVEAKGFSELDHGLQTAAILRDVAPDDVELQIAGLVHDLAHPWDGPGQPRHASMGAIAVRDVLGDRVADLILSHVPAKRYLVATHEEYASILSPDSVMTLAAQGGPMNAEEIAVFEQNDDLQAMVDLRIADDGAKIPGKVVPPLSTYEDSIRRLADLRSAK
jgi:predicted HD phosphohydrolase